jgi:hypothetical protein
MTPDQAFTIILSVLGIIFIPLMALLMRGAMKWTRVESQLTELIKDVEKLITDKDRTHADILKQMTDDRRATDKRLRWLEEYLWKGRNNAV